MCQACASLLPQGTDSVETTVQKALFRAIGSMLGALLMWPVMLLPYATSGVVYIIIQLLFIVVLPEPKSKLQIPLFISHLASGGLVSVFSTYSAWVPGTLTAEEAALSRGTSQVLRPMESGFCVLPGTHRL